MLQGIVKVIHRVEYYFCAFGTWFVGIMMFLTTFDVIGRSFFKAPIPGAFELSKFMLVIIVLFAIGYVQQKKENVRVTFFADKFSPRGQLIMEIIFTLVGLTVFVLMAWQGWLGALNARNVGTESDILRIPTYPFEFLISVGAFLASIELLIILISNVNKLVTGEYKTTGIDRGGVS